MRKMKCRFSLNYLSFSSHRVAVSNLILKNNLSSPIYHRTFHMCHLKAAVLSSFPALPAAQGLHESCTSVLLPSDEGCIKILCSTSPSRDKLEIFVRSAIRRKKSVGDVSLLSPLQLLSSRGKLLLMKAISILARGEPQSVALNGRLTASKTSDERIRQVPGQNAIPRSTSGCFSLVVELATGVGSRCHQL